MCHEAPVKRKPVWFGLTVIRKCSGSFFCLAFAPMHTFPCRLQFMFLCIYQYLWTKVICQNYHKSKQRRENINDINEISVWYDLVDCYFTPQISYLQAMKCLYFVHLIPCCRYFYISPHLKMIIALDWDDRII